LPFRNQHLLEIELATIGSSAIVPPAEGKGAIGRGSAPALLKGISRDNRRAICQSKLTEFRPLFCTQNPTGCEQRIADVIGQVTLGAKAKTMQNPTRSEERRVGKECRSRWERDDEK